MTNHGHKKIQIIGGALAAAFLLWLVLFGLNGDRQSRLNDSLLGSATKGDAATVATLIDRGADIDARDSMGMTPLMWATLKGNKETMTVLIEARCDFTISNNDGLTALELAEQNHKTVRAQFLRDAIERRASKKKPTATQ